MTKAPLIFSTRSTETLGRACHLVAIAAALLAIYELLRGESDVFARLLLPGFTLFAVGSGLIFMAQTANAVHRIERKLEAPESAPADRS